MSSPIKSPISKRYKTTSGFRSLTPLSNKPSNDSSRRRFRRRSRSCSLARSCPDTIIYKPRALYYRSLPSPEVNMEDSQTEKRQIEIKEQFDLNKRGV